MTIFLGDFTIITSRPAWIRKVSELLKLPDNRLF